MASPYDLGLDRNPANYQPLTPLSFLDRSADVFPGQTAIIHGKLSITYQAFRERCRRLATALTALGIGKNDTVSVMLANTPAMLDCHFGVPMTGAVLNTLNTRLDAATIGFTLDHAEAKVVIVDREYAAIMKEALTRCSAKPIVIDYIDSEFETAGERVGSLDYDAFLASGNPDYHWQHPADEWDSISLNYTSGTTGNPKGVVYSHRGAALMCFSNSIAAGMQRHPVYLWTLPMFHCNGWCFPWTIVAMAGTHVCLRWVRAGAIFDAIDIHRVTHLCGAPIVMSTLLGASDAERKPLPHKVQFITAAAPPPAAVLQAMEAAGFAVTHVYGLTETYGPAVLNEWKAEWNELDAAMRADRKAQQGVRYPGQDAVTVMDPETMQEVPHDGETIGEVMFRGNIGMKGYLKNPSATAEAFKGGWFHSGDLGVLMPDGYIKVKDRSKDIIISGGENISSIEVEDTLYRHPAVRFVAVVARPDEKWGEHPCAFIELKEGMSASAEELISFCKANLAGFKVPRTILFQDLPKTSTGKIQKYVLRERVRMLV
jgi:fatty-acyl-CoA synthase